MSDRAALLAEGYRCCAELTRRHGTTYYWGAALLPPAQRRDVHAVYALCRLADDIVDEPETVRLPLALDGDPAQRLAGFADAFRIACDGDAAGVPVLAAVADTVRRRRIDPECFERFFAAMTLDLTRTSWASWPELRDGYMEGSAAVIGEMMLPVLEPYTAEARHPARQLGLAFQLTNFIRDVGEDLDRGRVYLPADDLARHGADPWRRRVDPAWREFLAEQIARNRELYEQARPGIEMLPPASARCVGTAHRLYAQILDRIEAADFDVFSTRRRVPTWRKLATAGTVSAGTLGTRAPRIPLANRPQPAPDRMPSTWRQARPARIERSLARALDRDPGGWYVVGESRTLPPGRAGGGRVAGREVVWWRTEAGELRAGPGACPHLGAWLGDGIVTGDELRCRWHGMALPDEGGDAWRCLPAHDDGVLIWLRLPTEGETPAELPRLGPRPDPEQSFATVFRRDGRCEPRDVIANRLDPWHGAWFHPYAFSHLTVDEAASDADRLVLDVTFRLDRRIGVPVRAEFTCPDARTITMEIIDGEGTGSVVETHATPLGTGPDGAARSAVIEATIATSERPGFRVARRLQRLIRPLVRHTAGQLWIDDLAYAERRYALRTDG
ncbi:hypothetical protein CGZ98_15775 [Enemella evansiae]|uniref:DUF5914 domain-containing protein n=1 Tax=Enemella evansiae TaxID=2016499 RepID=UPI000B97105E|nr:DUF5914 domain-containing protein [Enemella evansiae]OYO09215.1 hypothetical protein CGZ98_15775 [Enemella evansiae]